MILANTTREKIMAVNNVKKGDAAMIELWIILVRSGYGSKMLKVLSKTLTGRFPSFPMARAFDRKDK